MLKGCLLSASIVLAGFAPAAAAAPHAAVRNIAVIAMASATPAPVPGTVRVVFFAPDSAALSPAARRIVASAVRQADDGRHVTLVAAEAADLEPASTPAPVWRARIAALKDAIVHSPAGRLSEKGRTAIHLAGR